MLNKSSSNFYDYSSGVGIEVYGLASILPVVLPAILTDQ